MKTLRTLLATALALLPVASASALDRALPAPRIKDNGDVHLSDDLKIGRFQGGKFISQPDTVQIQGSGSTGAVDGMTVSGRTLGDRYREVLNVLDYGVKCDGVTDDAPAINALSSSFTGKRIVFPSGATCRLGSTVDPGYPGNRASIFITGQMDFEIDARGTTFIVDAYTAPVSHVHMDRSKRWSWTGGQFIGNRAQLTQSAENAAFALTSNVDWKVTKMRFSGYGGNGAGFVGGWNVNGLVEDVNMEQVGLGFDVAWVKNLVVNRVTAKGANTLNQNGPGQVGDKFFSNIEDRLISVNFNYTGINFDDTDGVTITNSDISNFVTPIYTASGRNYFIAKNYIHDNPGFATSPGVPILLDYITNATYSSAGHPVSNVTIEGNIFRNNGSAVAGYAILIAASSITNSDFIDTISINNNLFDNNASTAIFADSTTKIKNLSVGTSNIYKGTAQTARMNNNALALAGPFQVDASGNMAIRNPTGGDVGYGWAAGNQFWRASVSAGNGVLYLLNQNLNRVPFAVLPDAPDGAFSIGNGALRMGLPPKIPSTPIANLPTCSADFQGVQYLVTDSNGVPARGAALAGGGATRWLVFCNTTAWVAQ